MILFITGFAIGFFFGLLALSLVSLAPRCECGDEKEGA